MQNLDSYSKSLLNTAPPLLSPVPWETKLPQEFSRKTSLGPPPLDCSSGFGHWGAHSLLN